MMHGKMLDSVLEFIADIKSRNPQLELPMTSPTALHSHPAGGGGMPPGPRQRKKMLPGSSRWGIVIT